MALVSAVALLGDKLDAIAESPLLAHAYAIGTLFKAECVLLLAVVVCYPVLLRIFRDLRQGLPALQANWPRHSLREKLALAVVTVAVLAITAVACYHGAYYLLGKRLLLKRYPQWAMQRANSAFFSGDVEGARWSLRACADVTEHPDCKQMLVDLNRRLELGRQMRQIASGRSRVGPAFASLMAASYRFDRDTAAYKATVRQWKAERMEVRSLYRQGLEHLVAGRSDQGVAALRDVNRRLPGFGASHKIIEEQVKADKTQGQGVFLSALRRYGVDAFVDHMLPPADVPDSLEGNEEGGVFY